ncbi:unnamed protein product [Owenia fusiformis]|uniref:Uncharacterized protein n=1 Tax=Owenia fusiformis TaxID=6347 RepID=A0A8S4N4L3_OWEFU|nr:unnamed protein product [Owenia fusiformis]
MAMSKYTYDLFLGIVIYMVTMDYTYSIMEHPQTVTCAVDFVFMGKVEGSKKIREDGRQLMLYTIIPGTKNLAPSGKEFNAEQDVRQLTTGIGSEDVFFQAQQKNNNGLEEYFITGFFNEVTGKVPHLTTDDWVIKLTPELAHSLPRLTQEYVQNCRCEICPEGRPCPKSNCIYMPNEEMCRFSSSVCIHIDEEQCDWKKTRDYRGCMKE